MSGDDARKAALTLPHRTSEQRASRDTLEAALLGLFADDIVLRHRPRTKTHEHISVGRSRYTVARLAEHAFVAWLIRERHGLDTTRLLSERACEGVDASVFFPPGPDVDAFAALIMSPPDDDGGVTSGSPEVSPEDVDVDEDVIEGLTEDELLIRAKARPAAQDVIEAELARRARTHELDQQARSLCSGCASSVTCLTRSIVSGEPEGTWGGLTKLDRSPLRNRFDKLRRDYDKGRMSKALRAELETRAADIASAILERASRSHAMEIAAS